MVDKTPIEKSNIVIFHNIFFRVGLLIGCVIWKKQFEENS